MTSQQHPCSYPVRVLTAAAFCLLTMCRICGADPALLPLVPGSAVIEVSGTSTFHDWQIIADEIRGTLHPIGQDAGKSLFNRLFDPAQPNRPNLHIQVKAESLKSGKKAMDQVTWKALRSSQHPQIRFTLLDLQPATSNPVNRSAPTMPVLYRGELFAAGVTRNIEMAGTAEQTDKGQIKLTGSGSLKMTDFSIQPPAIMLGLIQAGDEVKVNFSFLFATQP